MKTEISIHAARVGCDLNASDNAFMQFVFQSTQPEWAATMTSLGYNPDGTQFQSTQPEWAATVISYNHKLGVFISIHAARVGCDHQASKYLRSIRQISIHAARVGCDIRFLFLRASLVYFNPRSPSGLRHHTLYALGQVRRFQSTQPEWAATDKHFAVIYKQISISIHAARVGCDITTQ